MWRFLRSTASRTGHRGRIALDPVEKMDYRRRVPICDAGQHVYMGNFALQEMSCAVCGPEAPYRVKYEQNFSDSDLNFNARKTPTQAHFRILRCQRCNLIYSSPVLPEHEIVQLYRESTYLDEAQLENMLADYVGELRRAMRLSETNESLLEIGCANGFFLKRARDLGFSKIAGVEPGRDAVSQSDPEIKPFIVNDIFHDGLFDKQSFDFVCAFQVFDHLLDPNAFLQSARRILRPGGLVLAINHNIGSWLPTLLGKKSAMYDIEHIFLFSPPTMRELMEKNGFHVEYIRNTWNSYTLDYALKMFPLPAFAESTARAILRFASLLELNMRLPAGNMVTVARKV